MAAKKEHRSTAEHTLRHGYPTHRDAIWAAIRTLRQFTISDIEEWVNDTARIKHADDKRRVSRATVVTYVKGLEAATYVTLVEKAQQPGTFTPYTWELKKDAGSEAPRVTRKGEAVTQGNGNERMWRTMRVLGEFNRTELLAVVNGSGEPVSTDTAKTYLRYLERAGYLKTVQESTPGKQARYRFLTARYTGPRAPMIQRVKQVYDPNTREVVWSPNGGDA